MDKKKIGFICLTIILVLSNYRISYANRKVDVIGNVLDYTESEIIEYGVEENFKCKDRNIYIEELINLISANLNDYSTKVKDTEEIYSIDFLSSDGSGFINVIPYEDGFLYRISILKYDNETKICDLDKQLKEFTGNFDIENARYYFYAKAKLDKNTVLNSYNNKVVNLLKTFGTSDIKTISINNGFSTTANTHQYSSKKDNGRIIDFNFAVCSYSSGNYLIVGTPEITKTY